jgi:hypothetical protein
VTLAMLVFGIAIGSLWVGVSSVRAGRRKAAHRGDAALMHYPVPLPWLRGRLNTAKRVRAVGHFYLAVSAISAPISALIGLASMSEKPPPVCQAIVPVESVSALLGETVALGDVWQQGPRCVAHIVNPISGEIVVEIEVTAAAALIGADFEDQKAALIRATYVLHPLPQLGQGAIWSNDSKNPNAGGMILYRHRAATVWATIHTQPFSMDDASSWAVLLRESHHLLESQNGNRPNRIDKADEIP